MRSKLLFKEDGERSFLLVFDIGDEVASGLLDFAREHDLTAGHFTAIGGFSDVTFGYFNWDSKEFKEIPLNEQVEVLMLSGDIAMQDGETKVHAHVVVGRSDGTAHGGHLVQAHVRPTLEVVVEQSPRYLQRRYDSERHLSFISI